MVLKPLPPPSTYDNEFAEDETIYPKGVRFANVDMDMTTAATTRRDIETGLDIDDNEESFTNRYAPRLYQERSRKIWKKRLLFLSTIIFGSLALSGVAYAISNSINQPNGTTNVNIIELQETGKIAVSPIVSSVIPINVQPPSPPHVTTFTPTPHYLTDDDILNNINNPVPIPKASSAFPPFSVSAFRPPPPPAVLSPRPPRRNIHT